MCFLIKSLVQSRQEFFPATKCQATKAYGSRFFVAFNPLSSATKLIPNRSRLLPSFLNYLHFYFHRSQIFVGRVAQSVYRLSYGLDGLGSNSGEGEIFRPSRPALGSIQPPVKWVPGLSRGKVRPGRPADHSPPSSTAVMEE